MLTLFSTKNTILEHSGHTSLFDLFFPKVNLAFKKWTKKMSKIEKTKWTFKILENLKVLGFWRVILDLMWEIYQIIMLTNYLELIVERDHNFTTK